MRKLILFISLFIFCSNTTKTNVIYIQPYGNISSEYISEAVNGIKSLYKLNVNVLKSVDLPSIAYYKPRNRYKADLLLIDLHNKKGNSFKIIGLTEKDISTINGDIPDWGVFGLGSLNGYSSVVSTFRLQKNVTKEKVKERLVKIINHEIGHTLGLNHCPTLNCLMQDAKKTIKSVDAESGDLCNNCKKKINLYINNGKHK